MRRLSLLTIGIACFILFCICSCRKKEDVGLDVADKPLHCYNGELDEDEVTTDCGGSCGLCGGNYTSSCGMPLNTVRVGGPSGDTLTVESCIKTTNGSGDWVFTITLNNNDGVITIITDPTVYLNYDLYASNPNPSDQNEFFGEIEDIEPYTYTYSSGVNLLEGGGDNILGFDGQNYYIDFCSVSFYYSSFSTASLKIYAKVD